MSAEQSALAILRWATRGSGPMPRGDLHAAELLTRPNSELRNAIADLYLATAARLRLHTRAFCKQGPHRIGNSVAVLATALGIVHQPKLMQFLLLEIQPAHPLPDQVTMHGLVAAALPFAREGLQDYLRFLSPLTCVYERPAAGEHGRAMTRIRELLQVNAGKRSLLHAFCQPTQDDTVRDWRREALQVLRLGNDKEQTFVLEVYEAQMAHYEAESLRQIRESVATLTDPRASRDDRRLRRALSVAEWWEPLFALERESLDRLRERRYLGYSYREGIALHRMARRLAGRVA